MYTSHIQIYINVLNVFKIKSPVTLVGSLFPTRDL